MKLLYIYTSPKKKFDDETAVQVKMQIDNSLELGWKLEDIKLYMNFPYEYGGVKAVLIPDIYCDFDYSANKTLVKKYLIDQGLTGLHWYHDFDLFQNYPFDPPDLEGTGLGLTSYTYKPQWQCGSIFFTEEAKDAFDLWSKHIYDRPRPRVDEKVLTKLTDTGKITKYKKLNPTYNVTIRNLKYVYDRCEKPLKGLHFHPNELDYRSGQRTLEIYMTDRNRVGKVLMSPRLIKLFKRYGY